MTSQAQARPVSITARGANATSALDRVAGGLLFLLAASFMTVIMLAASIAPGYDYAGGAISDLGTIAATATLFNVTLVVVGALNAAAGWLLYRTHGRIGLLALYGIAGAGAIGAGLIPLGTSGLHSVFALLAFACFNLEAVLSAALVRGPMRWISIVAGVVGFVFVALMVIGDGGNAAAFGSIGHGGTERMIVYPVMLWMLAFGGYLMRGSGADRDR